ncbi:hypothetical protein DH2020_045876 [Rehmannia glutinosa]|uniref:VOC domain-containing protein n=1 Tax=Rehmannia glutinosa TaxID=99300 RepID=A0ABR0UD56_REHGL
MASLLSPPLNLPLNKVNHGNIRAVAIKTLSMRDHKLFRKDIRQKAQFSTIKNKASLEADVLDKDPVNVEAVDNNDGAEMIHLMELPNPDPLNGRPEHGGRDRHACIAIRNVSKLKDILDKAGIPYTLSRSGRPAIFTRDPDANALEFTQVD